MSELSTNIVEMYAESKHPAKWAAMQIVKEGRPSMTCGEAMDMIERVVGEAIESATQKILPCGHPASCGEPCGWCADKVAEFQRGLLQGAMNCVVNTGRAAREAEQEPRT